MEWANHGLGAPLCRDQSKGYPECSGAVLQALLENLINQGDEGWAEHGSRRVCVCVYARARGSLRLSMCILACVQGQDQRSKSTLERAAQSSSPTHLSLSHSLSPPLSLSFRRLSSAPGSWRVEEFTGLGSKRELPRARRNY